MATFLGRKLSEAYVGEIGNDFSTRIQGIRIKHHMGDVAIKLYDKFGLLGRVECTANDGTRAFQLAPVRKSIYSLPVLLDLMAAATRRHLEFLTAIEDPTPGLRAVEKIAAPVREGERSYRGFNLFHGADLDLFQAILGGEFTISGFQARQLRGHLPDLSGPQLSRLLKRLRLYGLIKKIGRRYKYSLTALGRTVATAALKLRELVIIPALNHPVLAGVQGYDHFAHDLTRKRLIERRCGGRHDHVRQKLLSVQQGLRILKRASRPPLRDHPVVWTNLHIAETRPRGVQYLPDPLTHFHVFANGHGFVPIGRRDLHEVRTCQTRLHR